jgi:lysophospholipase L1-like esterase
MNRALRAVAIACAALAVVLVGAGRAGAAGGGLHYYVALGDSLARSAQPNGDFQHGYAEQLLALLQQQDPSLRLEKLGCGGATTTDMIYGSPDPSCAFPHRTQLDEAIAFIRAHRRSLPLITIDIGANDLPDVGAIATNLPIILQRLRDAAGPVVPIVGMNYYDPNVATIWSATHDVGAVADRVNNFTVPLNNILEGLYTAKGDPYADVESAFQVTDLTLVGGTPLNVLRECQWTWICFPPPLGPDVHANTAGYGVIAQAFLDALP